MGSNGVRLFVPPFQDPVNPNLDPALVEAMNLVGTQMAAALYDAGLTGIAHQQTYDLWWHGGFRSTPTRHNMVGILTEAASTRLGSPITLSLDSVRQPGRGVNYAAPWPGGTWHLGDIVRYELITSQALVRLAARDRSNVIDRFVTVGQRAIEAGLAGNPFAYVLLPSRISAIPRPGRHWRTCWPPAVWRCGAASGHSRPTDLPTPPDRSACRWESPSPGIGRSCSQRSTSRPMYL